MKTHIKALDGLRAVAVLTVVAFHFAPTRLPSGWIGVDIFFVLSGFLITSILADEADKTSKIDFARFYLRRTLRLMPAFACLLALQTVAAFVQSDAGARAEELKAIVFSGLYLMNWATAFQWTAHTPVAHTWSLAMEEQFYLVWPLLFLAIRLRHPVKIIGVLIAATIAWRCYLVLSGSSFERVYSGFDTHADGMLIGALIAMMPKTPAILRAASHTVFIPAAAVAAIMLFYASRGLYTSSIGLSVNAAFAAWLILGTLTPGPVAALLSIGPMRYVGNLSYSLYLWHYPMSFMAEGQPDRVRLVLLVASFALAIASYHVIERPFLRLKSRLEAKASNAPTSSRGLDGLPPTQA